MPTLNFDLAPPAKAVGGVLAVPIDIQRVTALLSFDGAAGTAAGDATIEFTLGSQAGHPIFDLRQTITAAWLDGAPVPPADVAHHDFGGGAHAELRVLRRSLAAGSAHQLRVAYALGPPQASGAGSYQPGLAWSSGPRLAFNFGFTDLGAGRYLEAWVPANLIFDQFELALELRIDHTAIAHTVVTNGTVTALGANHWRVAFPARFTALSPMLELRATDTLAGASDTTVLPVSGTSVAVEAWKPTGGGADLAAAIANLKTHLADNEHSTGPYMHGGRFVAFMHVGGMEYEGATTTSPGALRHETFHSWWARGVKPASQADGWFDEAWTVYFDNGASASQPFNFADPAITLSPRNPWVRVTSGNAYSDGFRFWKGVASLVGVAVLKDLMAEFYRTRRAKPVTTSHIEEFLVARTGNPLLVDAFHRFVYGLADPSPMPDAWLRDDPAHAGTEAWGGRFWDSPDLWVRNADDGGASHQAPEYGQDNWFYARVRNRGASAVPHFIVTFNVKEYAGTQFQYPADFLPAVAAAAGFDLAPGASAVVKARWPKSRVPAPGSHPCLTAAVVARGDHPGGGLRVWEDNNLAQKNLTVVDVKPNRWVLIPFVSSNARARTARTYQLELWRPARHLALEASLLQQSGAVFRPGVVVTPRPPGTAPGHVPLDAAGEMLDCAGRGAARRGEAADAADSGASDDAALRDAGFADAVEAKFPAGERSPVAVTIRAEEQLAFGLRVQAPAGAAPGSTLRLDLVQREARSGRVVGGIAVEIRVV